MTKELILKSLRHCTGKLCNTCPGYSVDKDCEILREAADLIECQGRTIEELKASRTDSIRKMWDAMMKVTQVYSDRVKEVQKENDELRGGRQWRLH